MLDRFHKACEATHLLKLAYREKQERQEVEQLQRQEMEVKVQAWRQRREDVHRNLALMSTLDRELQAEFKEIHKSYARSHESVRFMRNVKDLQTKVHLEAPSPKTLGVSCMRPLLHGGCSCCLNSGHVPVEDFWGGGLVLAQVCFFENFGGSFRE